MKEKSTSTVGSAALYCVWLYEGLQLIASPWRRKSQGSGVQASEDSLTQSIDEYCRTILEARAATSQHHQRSLPMNLSKAKRTFPTETGLTTLRGESLYVMRCRSGQTY